MMGSYIPTLPFLTVLWFVRLWESRPCIGRDGCLVGAIGGVYIVLHLSPLLSSFLLFKFTLTDSYTAYTEPIGAEEQKGSGLQDYSTVPK